MPWNTGKKIVAGKWYNNGQINKRIKEGQPIPAGFVKGRT